MREGTMWIMFLILIGFFGHEAACSPLTDAFTTGTRDAIHVGLPALVGAERSSKLLRLTLQQTVEFPELTKPARLPECPKPGQLSKLLLQHINGTYGAMITGHLEVDTTHIQELQRCTYSSYIFFAGDVALKDMLVGAASAGPAQLCEALGKYCHKAFPKGSSHTLTATSAQRSPPLPPVLDFNCRKRYFDQALDHFDQAEQRNFTQIYWVCDDPWPRTVKQQAKHGNIIVFLGNESPLGTPSQPIVFEQARQMNALVVEVEHRYYGDSQPFSDNLQPDGRLNSTHLYRWLSVEQVLEDTAAVLAAVRQELHIPAAVPAIVIGGSYGGMLATYHRLAKPDVFAAAIAASAPLSFMLGTRQWADTSHRYHRIIAAAIDGNSGSSACGDAIRRGLARFKPLGQTPEGRRQLAATFNLCGAADAVLPDSRAAFALEMDQYGWFEGYAQANNQPALMGQVALACGVTTDVITAGGDELEALAAATTYFASNGSAGWCYDFNATLLLTGPGTYGYQSCTQGFPNTAMLPEKHRRHTLVPSYKVHHKEIEQECRQIWGQDLPGLKVPAVAADVRRLLREVGGVVFTNGEFDGWAGGSYLSMDDIVPDTHLALQQQQQPQLALTALLSKSRRLAAASEAKSAAAAAGKPQVAFVSYKAASHCTDTHNYAWHTPARRPASWARQRRHALQYAAAFADRWRHSSLVQEV